MSAARRRSLLLCAVLLRPRAVEIKDWAGPRFIGKVVVVTGGDSGIGKAAVEAFYLECGKVMLAGHNPNKTRDAVEAISKLEVPSGRCPPGDGPAVDGMAGDVADPAFCAEFVRRAVDKFGYVHVAVNSAASGGIVSQVGDEDFVGQLKTHRDTMNVNFYGVVNCMNAELHQMEASEIGGSIVNIGSIATYAPWEGIPMYQAAKGALASLGKQVAFEYARKGIRVNTVHPGGTNTSLIRGDMNDTEFAALLKWSGAITPLGRIAEPWEIAGPILFFASDMASYMTGTELVVDGMLTQEAPGFYKQWVPDTTTTAAPTMPTAADLFAMAGFGALSPASFA